MNFAVFLRIPIFIGHPRRLLLYKFKYGEEITCRVYIKTNVLVDNVVI